MRCDWLKPIDVILREEVLCFFSVTDTCRAQATTIVEKSLQKGYKQRRSHHHRPDRMEITKDVTERSFYKTTCDRSGANQINWKRGTARVEIQSENSICLTRTQHLRYIEQSEVFMHALRQWVCWTVRSIFIDSRENRLLISHQSFSHYIWKRQKRWVHFIHLCYC